MTEAQEYRKQRRWEEHQRRLDNKRSGRVMTPDGEGVVIGRKFRENTNGGPGTNQWRVQLDDGRVRHYSAARLTEVRIKG